MVGLWKPQKKWWKLAREYLECLVSPVRNSSLLLISANPSLDSSCFMLGYELHRPNIER